MTAVQRITKPEQLYIFTMTGNVMGSQAWSQTSISSTTTGGGGNLYHGTGHVSAPTTHVSSSSTDKLRIFLRLDNGNEVEAEFEDLDFGFREGHRVSLIYAGDQASQRGHLMSVVNHSTQKHAILHDRIGWILPQSRVGLGCFALIAVPLFAAVTAMVVLRGTGLNDATGPNPIAGIAVFLFVAWKLFSASQRRDKLKYEITKRLTAEASSVVEREKSRSGTEQVGDVPQ